MGAGVNCIFSSQPLLGEYTQKASLNQPWKPHNLALLGTLGGQTHSQSAGLGRDLRLAFSGRARKIDRLTSPFIHLWCSPHPTVVFQAECLVAAVAMMQGACTLLRPDGRITSLRLGLNTVTNVAEREFFVGTLQVRIHFIIVMIWWTGLAPCEFEFSFPGSLTSTFLDECGTNKTVTAIFWP